MAERPLRLLILGAHPDDADYAAGGTAALYRGLGHEVRMISMTNGDAGHHVTTGAPLAKRRKAEAAAAGAVIGAAYDVFENHDGELMPTLANRWQVIALFRSYKPDLVLTHRPNDYHPDHRYTSQLAQDAAFMVTVPAVVPGVPHLSKDPVIAYLPDDFQRPYPLTPDVVVDVGPVVDKIVAMLNRHQSQFYEWLPFNRGDIDQVPASDKDRLAWLDKQIRDRLRERANKYRTLLIEQYGKAHGERVEFAEAFEGCEYGSPLDAAARRRLFPFVKPV